MTSCFCDRLLLLGDINASRLTQILWCGRIKGSFGGRGISISRNTPRT